MITILIDSMKDTHFLTAAYEGLEDNIVLVNPSREDAEKVLTEHPTDRVMLMGHGSPSGLFGRNWMGYVVDRRNAHLLKGREVIGIWCYAKDFGKAMGLKGFFTSMFISNYGEYRSHFPNGKEYKDEEIFAEITNFVKLVNQYIKEGKPLDEWVELMQMTADYNKNFVEYNYDGLEYLDGEQEVTPIQALNEEGFGCNAIDDAADESYSEFRCQVDSDTILEYTIEELMEYCYKEGYKASLREMDM